MTATRTFAGLFESVRALLEAWLVYHVEEDDPGGADQVRHFSLIGRPDPALKPLLALFRETCPCTLSNPGLSYGANEEHPIACLDCCRRGEHGVGCRCEDTGFIYRLSYWQRAPEGALAGAVATAVSGKFAVLYEHPDLLALQNLEDRFRRARLP